MMPARHICAKIIHPEVGGSYTGQKKSFSAIFWKKLQPFIDKMHTNK
jgi:hypothetical protein